MRVLARFRYCLPVIYWLVPSSECNHCMYSCNNYHKQEVMHMCLHVDSTIKLKFNNQGWRKFWKVYRRLWLPNRITKFESPYRETPLSLDTNEVKMKGRPKSRRPPFVVDEGIHVHTKRPYIINSVNTDYYSRITVPVWGHKDDLIAFGCDHDAAFTKILIDEKAYQKMLDEAYPGVYTTKDY